MIHLICIGFGFLGIAGATAWHAREECSIGLAVLACLLWLFGVGVFYCVIRAVMK